MPRRIVSIRRRAEVGGLLSEWVEFLFLGYRIAPQPAFPEPSEADAKKMWARHRGQLLRWWLHGIPADAFRRVHLGLDACNKPHEPGTRPWAWWKFDALGHRQLLAVEEMTGPVGKARIVERAPTAEDEAQAWSVGHDWFGTPSGTCGGLYQFEEEVEYLERHGLLTAAEKKALRAEREAQTAGEKNVT